MYSCILKDLFIMNNEYSKTRRANLNRIYNIQFTVQYNHIIFLGFTSYLFLAAKTTSFHHSLSYDCSQFTPITSNNSLTLSFHLFRGLLLPLSHHHICHPSFQHTSIPPIQSCLFYPCPSNH